MTRNLIVLLIIAAFASAAAMAQGGSTAPAQAATAPDESVPSAYRLALENQPTAGAATAPPTLDDYAQERWRIKLKTLVPYTLLATPIILLIVLVAIRFSGVRSPEHIMLAAGLVLVIQATLLVSLTAEGSDALSASMGILGAIAGYLFGRTRQDAPASQEASTSPSSQVSASAGAAEHRVGSA